MNISCENEAAVPQIRIRGLGHKKPFHPDLQLDGVDVVEADPLVALVGVRPHPVLRIPDDGPAVFRHLLADLEGGRGGQL